MDEKSAKSTLVRCDVEHKSFLFLSLSFPFLSSTSHCFLTSIPLPFSFGFEDIAIFRRDDSTWTTLTHVCEVK